MNSFSTVADAFFFLGATAGTNELDEKMNALGLDTPSQEPQGPPPLTQGPPPLTQGRPPLSQGPPDRPGLCMPSEHRPVLVFDTETTGLKPAIVCQLAYIVVENGAVTTEYDELLRLPKGVKIERRAQDVHGISTNDCASRGVDAREALEEFARECTRILGQNGRVVAHNAQFDVRAIRETRAAHKLVGSALSALEVGDTFCTMKESKIYSPLTDKAGRKKAFRNEEMYHFFHGVGPTWAKLHSALDDVHVTALNYARGSHAGWW